MRRAMDDFLKTYPNDGSANLISIDYYLLRKQYQKCLSSIDRLDQEVSDPYLDLFRGNVYLEMDNTDKAKEFYERVLSKEPRNRNVVQLMLGVALMTKDYPMVTRMLLIFERDLGMELNQLDTVPEYAGYVASPEYQKFLNRNK